MRSTSGAECARLASRHESPGLSSIGAAPVHDAATAIISITDPWSAAAIRARRQQTGTRDGLSEPVGELIAVVAAGAR